MLYYEDQPDSPPLFEAAGCFCLFNRKILLLLRNEDKSYPDHWGIPTGKLQDGETAVQAVIRELFEETGILQSSDNLNKIGKYFIVNQDMSFIYHLFFCELVSHPNVKINIAEHKDWGWYYLQDALHLNLIPDLDQCIEESLAYWNLETTQLCLFPEILGRRPKQTSYSELEKNITTTESISRAIKTNFPRETIWYVSFGPPGSGKTTGLKAISKEYSKFNIVTDKTILNRNTRLNSYLFRAFQQKDFSFFFPFQIEVLNLRFIQSLSVQEFSFVDESIFSILAYTRALQKLGWLKDYEYQTFFCHYQTYLSLLPPPKAILYFDCGVRLLEERITKRGRKHEIYYTFEYLQTLRETFFSLSNELSKEFEIIRIDTERLRVKDVVELYGKKVGI